MIVNISSIAGSIAYAVYNCDGSDIILWIVWFVPRMIAGLVIIAEYEK
jgi:hypothetical protein